MSAALDTELDPRRYPRTAAYLGQLPEGLDSFATCMAKTTIHRTVHAHANEEISGLPPQLQAYLDGEAKVGRWMPQVHTLALIIAIVESRRLDSDSEPQWIRSAASLLFSTPMYKVLLWAATPRLMIRGADIRWSAFFRGSHLEAQVGDSEATVDLVAPPHMFDEALACIFTDVLRAALTYTEHDTAQAEIDYVGFTPGRIHYAVAF